LEFAWHPAIQTAISSGLGKSLKPLTMDKSILLNFHAIFSMICKVSELRLDLRRVSGASHLESNCGSIYQGGQAPLGSGIMRSTKLMLFDHLRL